MSHTPNGFIEAPIDVLGDVASVFGQKNGDVAYLCSNAHGQINKWARYKPVRWHSPDLNAAHQSAALAKWWQGDDLQCGLSYPALYTEQSPTVALQKMAEAMDANAPTWGYNAPRPGTDWCHLAAFDGYDHQAVCPFGELAQWRREVTTGSTSVNIHRFFIPEPEIDEYNLNLSDINVTAFGGAFANGYLGLMLLNETGTGYIAATSTEKIGSTAMTNFNYANQSTVKASRVVQFSRKSNIGKKRMYLFASTIAFSYSEGNGNTFPTGTCVLIPLNGPYTSTF